MTTNTRRGERGASTLELALSVTVLFLLLFGIVEFGSAYHRYQGLQAAAREGARAASLPQSTRTEIGRRVGFALPIPDTETCPASEAGSWCMSVTPDVERPCNLRSGQDVVVEVASRVRVNIPLWSSPEITLTGRGVFRCE